MKAVCSMLLKGLLSVKRVVLFCNRCFHTSQDLLVGTSQSLASHQHRGGQQAAFGGYVTSKRQNQTVVLDRRDRFKCRSLQWTCRGNLCQGFVLGLIASCWKMTYTAGYSAEFGAEGTDGVNCTPSAHKLGKPHYYWCQATTAALCGILR